MIIETISPTTVKITLKGSDMERFGLKYENLSKDSFETKLLLSSLISVVTAKGAMRFDSDRLFIEAFEQQDGGCIIYISSIPERAAVKLKAAPQNTLSSFVTLETKNSEKLREAVSELSGEYSEFIKDSRLYSRSGAYRLVIETAGKQGKRFLKFSSDNSMSASAGEIPASVTEEHWNCLIPENALPILKSKLSELP